MNCVSLILFPTKLGSLSPAIILSQAKPTKLGSSSEANTIRLLRRWSEATVRVNHAVDEKRRSNNEFHQARDRENEARREKIQAKNAHVAVAASRTIRRANSNIRFVLTQINHFQILTVSRYAEAELIGGFVESGDFNGGVLISDGLTLLQMSRLRQYCLGLHLQVLN